MEMLHLHAALNSSWYPLEIADVRHAEILLLRLRPSFHPLHCFVRDCSTPMLLANLKSASIGACFSESGNAPKPGAS